MKYVVWAACLGLAVMCWGGFTSQAQVEVLDDRPPQLERLKYNNPWLLVDLGVGLWAWPLPMDFNGNGLTDLVMLDHEGYLALFRREQQVDEVILRPGERIFRLEDESEPWRLNERWAGGSGRYKLSAVMNEDNDRWDLLVNSVNADLYENLGEADGMVVFRDHGAVDSRRLSSHTTSPTVIDLQGDGKREILIGAEDGFFYHMPWED